MYNVLIDCNPDLISCNPVTVYQISSAMQGFMGEVYASFVFISVLFGTVVDKRYPYSSALPSLHCPSQKPRA